MTSPPWGLSPWGLGGWGAKGVGSSITATVYALTANSIFVLTTTPMLQRSVVLDGDSMNPSTWQVSRTDTGELIPVAFVEVLSSTNVIVHTQTMLPGINVQLQLQAPSLLDATGTSAPIDPVFAGVTEEASSTPALLATNQTQAPRDLLNRPAPSSAGSLSGTLVIKGGDYTTEISTSLLRKLILRRLTARPGDFYHLPQYGVGLRVKQPVPTGDLVRLQAEIQRQIQLEPEVDSAKVVVTQSTNTLFVQVAVKTKKTGQTVDIGMPFEFGGSQ